MTRWEKNKDVISPQILLNIGILVGVDGISLTAEISKFLEFNQNVYQKFIH